VRASMIKAANDPVGGTPEQFATFVRTDAAKYARLAKELGIKGQ
jgi:tripartite-type tricarboxylate transporter receptor subunit TctC